MACCQSPIGTLRYLSYSSTPKSNGYYSGKKAPGRDRGSIPGEIEAKAEEENRRMGIVINPAVPKQIKRLNDEMKLGVEF